MVVIREKEGGRRKPLADQPTGELDAVSACTVCEKAVVADANEPRWKHMQQKAAEELVGIQGKELLGVAVRIVAIAEADPLTVEADDPGVADGDAMGVVGEIREHLCRSAERWLAVHDPVGSGGSGEEQVESDRIGDHSFGELERSLTPCLTEKGGQQRAEATREHFDGKKECGLRSRTPLPAMD